ncbi:hypothetical protein KAI12_05260, partial [Candidatus Bathyarchaeota archaeon]|nr:hypothetical protein [Candidatus Bathyarchaeota archaeon]
MSTHLKKKEERILKILTRVSKESAKGTPIVVEGRKDVETLRILGVMGPIIPAKTGGKSFLDVISKIEDNETRKVILLLDFDKRGKEGTFHLRRCLE